MALWRLKPSPTRSSPRSRSHGMVVEFGRRVQDAVLFGFTVFSHEDARHAAARLLERGPARTKLVLRARAATRP